MQLIRCSLLLISAVASVLAGGIEGLVVDPSGRPVPAAVVRCGGRSFLTDDQGRFRIEDVARCPARVAASGFETASQVLVSDTPARIALALAGVAETVLVSAVREQVGLEQAGVAGNILPAADIERRQFPLVVDLLREIPGLHVARFGRHGGATQVFARGAQRTGTLVMIDGMPVNDPGGDLNFAHLLSGAIERMEVVRGPESALFGAEASSAVVQLFTRTGDPERRRPRTRLMWERGSFQTDRWLAGLSGGSGRRLDYSTTVEQFHTVGEFPNDAYRNTSGTASVGWRLAPATELRGLFRSFDTFTGVPNRVGYRIYDLDARRMNRDYTASLRLDDVRGPGFAHRLLVGHHRLRDLFVDERLDGPYAVAALVRDTALPVPRIHLVRLLDPRQLPLALIPPGTRLVTRSVRLAPLAEPSLSVTSRTTADYQGTWSHAGGALLGGYEYERQAGVISTRDVDRGNHGLFLHKRHSFAGRVSLSAGARWERNSVFGNKFTPRAAAAFRLAGDTWFRLSAGRGITEPSLLQIFARDSTFVGNPRLRPEKTSSYEAGLVREWWGRRIRTELSTFHSSFRGLIVFVPTAIGTFENVDASHARGFEISGQARLVKYVTASASYTLTASRIDAASTPNSLTGGIGQQLLRRPRHSAALSLAIAPSRWSLDAGATFTGERQDSDVFGVTRNPGYWHVWAGGALRLGGGVLPFLRADNLLNTRYHEALGYSALGRTLRGGVRWEW